MGKGITFTLYGTVTALDELFQAAMTQAIRDGVSAIDIDSHESLVTDGKPDISKCIRTLLDPGSVPGLEIEDSNCEVD